LLLAVTGIEICVAARKTERGRQTFGRIVQSYNDGQEAR
jgi:hypothetical protein